MSSSQLIKLIQDLGKKIDNQNEVLGKKIDNQQQQIDRLVIKVDTIDNNVVNGVRSNSSSLLLNQ